LGEKSPARFNMAYARDLHGKQYGQLRVIDLVPEHASGKRVWLCQCTCGTWRILPTERLTTGNTKSCGCLRKELCRQTGKKSQIKLSAGESGYRQLLRKYKRSATERDLAYELSELEFRELTKSNCHYCNRAPAQTSHGFSRKDSTRDHTAYTYNGIDRKDPSLGYIPSNCVTACSTCNWAKQDLSHDAFLDLITQIYKNTAEK
jgi:5-methylcytosine-specific restriction endonuclease McrA